MADELLTTRQVMKRLGVKHPDKVLALVHAKLLAYVNINTTGRRPTYRFYPADVEAFLQSHRLGPLPPKPATPKTLPMPTRDTLKRLIAAGHG
jgi:hypothetical protein